VVVADTTDRLVRSHDYRGEKDPVLPAAVEFDALVRAADGVTMYTLEHPDAPPAENHGTHTKRGKDAKGHKGGRGHKVTERMRQQDYREECLPEARRLREEGLSYPAIGRHFGVSGKTAFKWLKRGAETGAESVTPGVSEVKPLPAPSVEGPESVAHGGNRGKRRVTAPAALNDDRAK
jgi:hypothetical protein